MQKIKKAALVCCSNPLAFDKKPEIDELKLNLKSIGIETVESPCMFSNDALSFISMDKIRGEILLDFYKDKTIDAVFDISGGDLSNTLLNSIDFQAINDNPKPFFGYSDLTVIINSIYKKTGVASYLYQMRNINHCSALKNPLRIFNDFNNSVNENFSDFLNFSMKSLRGKEFGGIVVGGNIRCFLKLAGTEFFPDLRGKVILLESLGGDIPKIASMLAQLNTLKVFETVNGVILGTFTQIENNGGTKALEDMALYFIERNTPVVKTQEIGHSIFSKAIKIGGEFFVSL